MPLACGALAATTLWVALSATGGAGEISNTRPGHEALAGRGTGCNSEMTYNLGGDMKRTMILAIGVGLIGSPQICWAADATWVAVSTLERGTSQNCGGGQGNWQVEIKGNTLKRTTLSTNRSFTALDLKSLQPDGSGKVTGKDDKNREFYLVFEPGSGPRIFHHTNSLNACGWVFTPR